MRRWLLALICILLVADGYWASRNLVLKSADANIYWFNFTSEGPVLFERDSKGLPVTNSDDRFNLIWQTGAWFNDGQKISEVGKFIEYVDGPHSACGLTFHLNGDPSVETAYRAIQDAFDAGAGIVGILTPLAEMQGITESVAPLTVPSEYGAKTCPYADEWRRNLKYGETAVGYPPSMTKN